MNEMLVMIKGKEKELVINKIGFIRKLDSIYKTEESGTEFGVGLMLADVFLDQYSVPALADIITVAIEGVNKNDVEESIEAYAIKEGSLESMFEELRNELGKSELTKATMSRHKVLEEKRRKQLAMKK